MWSQDVDQVSSKPLNDPNVMYTLHFYAATHYSDLQNKLRTAVSNGTPVFVSEFGSCDASGNGGYDFDNADTWLNLLDQYNIISAIVPGRYSIKQKPHPICGHPVQP